MGRKLSPALLARLEALDGCRGRWIVDCRAIEGDRGYALRGLKDASFWPMPDGSGRSWAGVRPEPWPYRFGTVEDAAAYCAATGWQARLLWCSEWLDDDARWPGGYAAPSVVVSNARVFRDEYRRELVRADGDADGLALDVRYITPEMLETLEALEACPLISSDDHSALEFEIQAEAWESWAASEWRDRVRDALAQYAPEDVAHPRYWADDVLDAVPDDVLGPKLEALFNACAESANVYWEEQSCGGCSEGYWIDTARVAQQLDCADLAELTGLPLLPAGQEWRREPYPWPGADPAPLVP